MNVLHNLLNQCTVLITDFEVKCREANDRIIEEMAHKIVEASKQGDTRIQFDATIYELHPNQVKVINQRFRHQAQLKCSFDKKDQVFTLSLPTNF